MRKTLDIATLEPMLAMHTDVVPEGAEWCYEPKWDGMRAFASITRDGEVTLLSRNGRDVTPAFPELEVVPQALRGRCGVLDGEIVAFEPDTTIGSFRRLQRRIGVSGTRAAQLAEALPIRFVAFDVIELDNEVLIDTTLDERRTRLQQLLHARGRDAPWLLCPRIPGTGAEAFAASVRAGHEGVVAKIGASAYTPGNRDAAWQKARRVPREEFVVVGWVASPDDAARPGALVLATRSAPHAPLEFAGITRAGGIDDREREVLHTIFLTRFAEQPTALGVPSANSIHHLHPELVVDVEFAGVDEHGRPKTPSYVGLRPDRDPMSVVGERVGRRR